MEQATVMGLIIGALATLIPLFIAVVTPVIRLNKTIQKLNYSIDRLNESDTHNKVLLDKIDLKLEKHDKYLLIDKQRLDNISKRLKRLDDQEGFNDDVEERK